MQCKTQFKQGLRRRAISLHNTHGHTTLTYIQTLALSLLLAQSRGAHAGSPERCAACRSLLRWPVRTWRQTTCRSRMLTLRWGLSRSARVAAASHGRRQHMQSGRPAACRHSKQHRAQPRTCWSPPCRRTWNAERIRLSSYSTTAPLRKSSDTASHTSATPSRSNTLREGRGNAVGRRQAAAAGRQARWLAGCGRGWRSTRQHPHARRQQHSCGARAAARHARSAHDDAQAREPQGGAPPQQCSQVFGRTRRIVQPELVLEAAAAAALHLHPQQHVAAASLRSQRLELLQGARERVVECCGHGSCCCGCCCMPVHKHRASPARRCRPA